jgi:tRNA-uridine aminocarboxypropyltransferase
MASRCTRCRMHERLCLCPLLPRLWTRTRVVLLAHKYETKKSTSTGLIGVQCLVNSEVVLRGEAGRPLPPRLWQDGTEPLLLYPDGGGQPLQAWSRSERPVTLIVLDGTWGQAARARSRIDSLRGVPAVALTSEGSSPARLRAAGRADRLCTLEALARALGVLEGPQIRRELETVLRVLVERTLWSRGALAAEAVTGGIPAAMPSGSRANPVRSR